jgi:hypothetical protein
VNASASSDCQPKGVWEGRAAHLTAKATDSPLESERGLDLSGVWAVARFQRRARNRRDPRWRSTSDKDLGYKAGWLKSPGAGRESEGFVVPKKACNQTRWREGTLLWSRRPGGKCEGIAFQAQLPLVKARQLRPEACYERVPNPGSATDLPGMRVGAVTSRYALGRAPFPSDVHATLGRPSLSRVQENCTHGLKGGSWKRIGN